MSETLEAESDPGATVTAPLMEDLRKAYPFGDEIKINSYKEEYGMRYSLIKKRKRD